VKKDNNIIYKQGYRSNRGHHHASTLGRTHTEYKEVYSSHIPRGAETQMSHSLQMLSITLEVGDATWSNTRALRSSHMERIVSMMSELAFFESRPESLSTTSGHHSEIVLVASGIGMGNPRR
jgi:hypothetical protein